LLISFPLPLLISLDQLPRHPKQIHVIPVSLLELCPPGMPADELRFIQPRPVVRRAQTNHRVLANPSTTADAVVDVAFGPHLVEAAADDATEGADAVLHLGISLLHVGSSTYSGMIDFIVNPRRNIQ